MWCLFVLIWRTSGRQQVDEGIERSVFKRGGCRRCPHISREVIKIFVLLAAAAALLRTISADYTRPCIQRDSSDAGSDYFFINNCGCVVDENYMRIFCHPTFLHDIKATLLYSKIDDIFTTHEGIKLVDLYDTPKRLFKLPSSLYRLKHLTFLNIFQTIVSQLPNISASKKWQTFER